MAMLFTVATLAQDDDATLLTVITWNVESGEADPATIAEQMLDYEDVDLWGLTEVESANDAELFEAAAEAARDAEFGAILSESGGEDKLLILYNEERFELIDVEEIHDMNPGRRVRSPIIALLIDRETEQELAFMVNHLKSGNSSSSLRIRHEQAGLLNEWGEFAADLELPVIAVGDYNFYYDVDGSSYDRGLDILEDDDVFDWVEPVELIRTQCTVDGNDCRFNSVVDFIFVAGPAQEWDVISEVVVVEGDFPDDDLTSDHRPVIAVFEINTP
jgi:endonuclease/exonuclease/phosphatase family metal-dependent hydrolase